jgi:hypothetical protein
MLCQWYSHPILVLELLAYSLHEVDGGRLSSADGKHEFKVKYGSDWMIVPTDSRTITIDARVSAESDDGTNMELAYLGKMCITEEVRTLFDGSSAARETQFGEPYYYTAPRIWSRSDEFAWVNDSVFLAMGKLRLDENGRVEAWYRILKVG